LVLVAEWGYFELMPFIAGTISEIDLAAGVCLFSFELLLFVFGGGFAKATCN